MCKHVYAGDNAVISIYFYLFWAHVILIWILFCSPALNLSSRTPVVNPKRDSLSNSFHLSIPLYFYLIWIVLSLCTGLFFNKKKKKLSPSISTSGPVCWKYCATKAVRKRSNRYHFRCIRNKTGEMLMWFQILRPGVEEIAFCCGYWPLFQQYICSL